jgi:hypothetical protein
MPPLFLNAGQDHESTDPVVTGEVSKLSVGNRATYISMAFSPLREDVGGRDVACSSRGRVSDVGRILLVCMRQRGTVIMKDGGRSEVRNDENINCPWSGSVRVWGFLRNPYGRIGGDRQGNRDKSLTRVQPCPLRSKVSNLNILAFLILEHQSWLNASNINGCYSEVEVSLLHQIPQ